jgi:NAD(P)-dependent dehydrogenase (short-subunit alcohol dehydrogenase family)
VKTWVIGGLSGIGAAVVERLRECEKQDIDDLASDWRLSLKVTGENVDVTDPIAIRSFIDRHTPFDEVVYCAGIQRLGFLGHYIRQNVKKIFAVNVLGFINVLDTLRMVQASQPLSVVAIVSDASHVAMRGSIGYCASKAALAQAIRVAARETAPDWRVNGVSPGVVADTPMSDYIDKMVPVMRGWTVEQAAEYEQSLIPMRRRAQKAEVAQVVIDVLRGPEYMTGSIIEITGGK